MTMKRVTLATRMWKARHQAAADRVGDERKNNWNGAGLFLQRGRCGCSMPKKKVGLQRDEFLREPLHLLRVAG
jgi:hypothetical protein